MSWHRRHPLAVVAQRLDDGAPRPPRGRPAPTPLAMQIRRPAGPVGRVGSVEQSSGGPTLAPGPAGKTADQLQQALRTVGLLAIISALGWLLTSEAVSGPLAIPLTSLDEVRRWLDDGTAAILPAALLRLAALGLCAYLALALLLTLVAQLIDRRTGGRALQAVRRLLPAALRGLLTGGAQCSLVAATAFPLATTPVAAGLGDGGPTATMTKLDPGRAHDPGDPATSIGVTTSTATMTRLPAGAPPEAGGVPTTVTTTTTIAPTTAPTSLAPVPLPPRASAPANPSVPATPTADTEDETWTVTPGDTFWSIAEEALADRHGHLPTQHEIVRYWHQLITSNRSRLAAPTNPDLLLPGQSLVLPPPS